VVGVSESNPGPRLSYVIGRLDRTLRRQIEETIQPDGLTVPEFTTLSVLRRRAGLSNAQLARRALITPQSMSQVLSALIGKGLVRREQDPNHGRLLRSELTDEGHSVLARCEARVDDLERRMLDGIEGEDQRRLAAMLASCVHMLGAGLGDH
jgi:DNA-binding MarR family transcriptional regulator